jgi:hypothetical protein
LALRWRIVRDQVEVAIRYSHRIGLSTGAADDEKQDYKA